MLVVTLCYENRTANVIEYDFVYFAVNVKYNKLQTLDIKEQIH